MAWRKSGVRSGSVIAFFLRLALAGAATVAVVRCGVGDRDVVQRRSHKIASADAAQGTAPIDVAAQNAELESIIGFQCPATTKQGEAYGIKSIDVFAGGYGQSAGLYLRAGQTARVAASGEWTIWENVTQPFGPEGHPELSEHLGCRKGALLARLGLGPDAPRYCVGAAGTVTAPHGGIVYLSMNDSGAQAYHGGTITATVTSDGDVVPEVSVDAAETFPFCDVTSGWVELRGTGAPILLTVPTALAESQRDGIASTLARLGDIYNAARELAAGEVPFEGETLRLMPDFAVRSRGWIVAANPLLFDPRMLNGVAPSRTKILQIAAPGAEVYEIARAIGVVFSRARGGRYQPDERAAQAWGSLFALHASEKFPLGTLPESVCAGRELQLASGTTSTWLGDPKLQTCLLMELTKRFGWDLHRRFFAALPSGEAWDAELAPDAGSSAAWAWVRSRYVALAGAEAGLIFAAFRAP